LKIFPLAIRQNKTPLDAAFQNINYFVLTAETYTLPLAALACSVINWEESKNYFRSINLDSESLQFLKILKSS